MVLQKPQEMEHLVCSSAALTIQMPSCGLQLSKGQRERLYVQERVLKQSCHLRYVSQRATRVL